MVFAPYLHHICTINILDTAFLYALIEEGVDSDNDSLISINEAEAVTFLDIGGVSTGTGNIESRNIVSLKGIEAFINLDTLICAWNKLDSLDFSDNSLLKVLDCEENQLSSLIITNNSMLDSLDCSDNMLTALDVSGTTSLRFLRCRNNQLTSLDVSKNTSLVHLDCRQNYHLNNLDVSSNLTLEILQCGQTQLSQLDVTANTGLIHLHCGFNQLSNLDVTVNIAMEVLWCDGNQLGSLNVSNNTALLGLSISDMPTLQHVCVWTVPFPPGSVVVDRTGSPNVSYTTDCTSGLMEHKLSKPSIHPNPAMDVISIQSNGYGPLSIEINSINGQLLYRTEIEKQTHQIDFSEYQQGTYLITVRAKDFSKTEKIVKQ